ncbi:MAG: hypothetical protein WBA46_17735 [Thermomicrobiales bacterium]
MSKRDYKADLLTFLTYAPQAFGLDWQIVTEHRFHPIRRWRFDYCWPDAKIAVEYDGIMFGHASHSSLAGILRDSDKANEAQRLGWRVFRANAKTVGDNTFMDLMDAVLADEAERRAA